MKVVLISGIPILPAHEGNRSRILALSRAIRDLDAIDLVRSYQASSPATA